MSARRLREDSGGQPLDGEFCVHCGHPAAEPGHDGCENRRTVLEPPRYCGQCARRMVVQVTPAGWTARCSRHGEVRAPQ